MEEVCELTVQQLSVKCLIRLSDVKDDHSHESAVFEIVIWLASLSLWCFVLIL